MPTRKVAQATTRSVTSNKGKPVGQALAIRPTTNRNPKQETHATMNKTITKKAPKKSKNPAEGNAKMNAKRKGGEDIEEPVKRKQAKRFHVNKIPTQTLDIFVMGEGSFGELGLGSEMLDGKKPRGVRRPRLNSKLNAGNIGVVQIACGGMHVVALTKTNTILSWGVNDQGALGRDTTWEGNNGNTEAMDVDDDVAFDLNPLESTPMPVDMSQVDPSIRWTQVAASDSASFALTEDGRVYGWGTFRGNEGLVGYSETVKVQRTPALICGLKDITQLAAGSNHVLALDSSGYIQAWGTGQQHQLGRRIVQAHPTASLNPAPVRSLPMRGARAVRLACGSYSSFALDQEGRVYAWGLNNYGGLGIVEGAGEDAATITKPRLVEALEGYKIVDIDGGQHHSLACTEDGQLLAWGRIDFHQVGLPREAFTEDNAIFDERNTPRILKIPTVIPGLPHIVSVSAGGSHCLAIAKDGRAYSWGFSQTYQTGQGQLDDVEEPTLIDNTAVKGKELLFAGAGGQYSILAGKPS